ncbi:T9SS type A sorting domain-containing protein [Ekhidna sp.]|uniref:T9SS type A sorting domain-containing protein n=1 Tax=Ekhidna sp. TaxID=2608089 RepID=UPI003B5B0DB0
MRRGLMLTLCVLLTLYGFSQEVKKLDNVNVSNTKAIKLGKTKPVKELLRVSSTNRDKKAARKSRVTAAPENFFGRNGSNAIRPELEHQGPDPIRQTSIPKLRAASISPIINMDGLASSFGSPNDPTGDVGVDYYVQAINATDIAVYDKSDGTLIDEFAANTLWTSIGESSAGDPIVLFDHEVERWVITEFTAPASQGGTENLLFAISATSDPLGSYDVYAFSPPSFPDYPKWAIWKDYYMVTTNEGGPGSLHQYFFDRAAFLAGDEEVTMQRVEITGNSNTEAGFYVTTPVSWTGSTAPEDANPIAVKINDSSWGQVTNDAVEVFTFDVDLEGTTTVTTTTIETTAFDSYPCDAETGGFACLSQGGSSTGIDGIPEVVMNLPHYRNFATHESIVLSFITDVADGDNLSGIRWMELRRTTGDWDIYQEGTFAPDDGLHRFMSSISMDQDGNIALAYNTSGPDDFVSIKFTGRYAEDPLGQMTLAEYDVVNGTGPIQGFRFGDYAQMAIDPEDWRTFWYTTEYASSEGTKTRIVAFKLENPNDIAVESIDEPNSALGLTATESVVATVKNLGENAASGFDIILKLGNSEVETFNYSGTLNSKDTYQHTFANTIDLSTPGDYELSAEVDYSSDEDQGNNLFTKSVSHLVEDNVAIAAETESLTCSDEVEVVIELTNKGASILESTDIEVYLNESLNETINWTGSLETGELVTESITITGLVDGSNAIEIIASNPNGATDLQPENNEVNLSSSYDSDLEQVKLTIIADDYPEEISWEVRDEEGAVLFSGGTYPGMNFETIEEYFCVDVEACYDFVIFDSFGDGICCGEGEGSYTLTDGSDNVLVEGNGEYASSETTEFCIGCTLEVSISTTNQGSTTFGSISILASRGYDYQYSIDGGDTFSSSTFFSELEAGEYEVVVSSNGGECVVTETVEISYVLDVNEEIEGLKIYPNPTEGVFKLSYRNNSLSGFLNVEVIDMNGKKIQHHRFSKYDDAFEGTISLYAYPDGLYFLKFGEGQASKLVKVMKH